MKKILILDDFSLTLQYLTGLAGELDTKCEVFPFDNVKDAYQCAMERTIDLFVVDIILNNSLPSDTSGLKFVENIRRVDGYAFTPVIFVTSLEDQKAYTYEKLHCYSYIEKPFDDQRVKQILEQCLAFPGGGKRDRTLYLRKDGIILAVDRDDLVYAESINHKLYIHTRQNDLLEIPYLTLKKLLEDMESPDIIQCSRNTIINKQYVENVDISNRIIQLKDGMGRVMIGVMFKKYMRELFM